MIPVVKPYLPNKEKYKDYVEQIYTSGRLTNGGPLVHELEDRLAEYLGVDHIICVSNGTIALNVAYKALCLQGEVITTPNSYVATTSSLVWDGIKPVFADISPDDFNINPNNIRRLINKNTSAIVAVHVFGNPCKVEEIQSIADEFELKVVYDAAHAFDVFYNLGNNQKKNILTFGDISTISFHATKLFHTIEGGAIATNDAVIAEKIRSLINFGYGNSNDTMGNGINAKMNELEAAMGLCVLAEINNVKASRKNIWDTYFDSLKNIVTFQKWNVKSSNNYAYAPILLQTEEELFRVLNALEQQKIFPRRYFYPSLDTLPYFKKVISTDIIGTGSNVIKCITSQDITKRILCLPIYPGLTCREQSEIIKIIQKSI